MRGRDSHALIFYQHMATKKKYLNESSWSNENFQQNFYRKASFNGRELIPLELNNNV